MVVRRGTADAAEHTECDNMVRVLMDLDASTGASALLIISSTIRSNDKDIINEL